MSAVTDYFSRFHDFARRQLGIKPSVVNEYIAHHATASINGRTVTLSYDDKGWPVMVSAHVGLGHTSHATKWVNEFNERAGATVK